ncbi:MAG: biotin--[acetyl-CoA-carboxylase] ligase [Planctomycetaceae bacterium]|nr:biotin--[acetyl-CoA-carboxylase] ligase [Planctomycetaceae bacterium]
MSALSSDTLRARLHTRIVGKRILCVDACDSTNDLAWKEALAGAADGTAVFAEEQVKGRGRFGRTWTAPKGKGLLCSVVLRPEIDVDRVPLMTAMAALAAADVVGDAAQIRFPNDVMVGGRKIAGILVEARFISSKPDVFIVGVGLNVNGHPPDMNATSLGETVSRVSTARALLEALDDWYGRLSGSLRDYRKAWRERSFIVGKRVRVKQNGKYVPGVVEDVDPMDGIVLRLDSGHPRTIRSEHVEHLEVIE